MGMNRSTIFVPLNYAFENLYSDQNSTFKSLDDLLSLPQPVLEMIVRDYVGLLCLL